MKITLYYVHQVINTNWPRCSGLQRSYFQFNLLIHHEVASLPEFIIPSPIALAIFPAPRNPMLTESFTLHVCSIFHTIRKYSSNVNVV